MELATSMNWPRSLTSLTIMDNSTVGNLRIHCLAMNPVKPVSVDQTIVPAAHQDGSKHITQILLVDSKIQPDAEDAQPTPIGTKLIVNVLLLKTVDSLIQY
jgi:hypothetical protein